MGPPALLGLAAMVMCLSGRRAHAAGGDGGTAGAGGAPPTANSAPGTPAASRPADAGATPADAAVVPAGPPGPAVHAPVPLTPLAPKYSAGAETAGVEGDVALILTIDPAGAVTDVEVESELPGGLTESAVAAARAARFHPATDAGGRATGVRIRWLVHFTAPPRRTALPGHEAGAGGAGAAASPLPAPANAAGAGGAGGAGGAASTPARAEPPGVERFPLGLDAQLALRVRERGTGKSLPKATAYIEDTGELLHLDTEGRGTLALPPGAYVVVLRAPGHAQEEFVERLHAGERLDKTYFISKERFSEYETVVRAPPPRAETGVVTLQAEEIHNIPGTFGDPFRTAMLLPGVGSIISGLGYPVIRGESPGQTGTFIDDVKVPLLYHLGFGPAVVHPLFLESLDFHPGNFPAEYGRFTGALIQAHTTGPADDVQTMLSVDLFKLSAYHNHPLTIGEHKAAVAVAARYGTFAFLARAIDPRAVLEYWDYQLRGDLEVPRGNLRLLLFGAQDRTGTSAGLDAAGNMVQQNILAIGFHRLSLTFRGHWPRADLDAGLEVGPDTTHFTGSPENSYNDAVTLTETIARPHAAVTVPLGTKLKLRAGAELLVQSWNVHIGEVNVPGGLAQSLFPEHALTPGVFLQADWQPTPRWLISPGVRFDYYDYKLQAETLTAAGVDPRLSARFQLRPGLFVKGGLGIYRSPPRFLLPWPGLEGFGLDRGLNRSYQASLGAETRLPGDATLEGQVYFNWLARVSEFDFGPNSSRNVRNDDGTATTGQSTYKGRAYGLELIARRRLGHRLFGWATYTLARAERDYPLAGWRPADFDQTQLVNLVASYALGRSWTVSGVFHYNSGRPYTPGTLTTANPDSFVRQPQNRNDARLPDFWRVDLRIDKREEFGTWYLDFYVDWLNISLQREATAWNDRQMRADTALLTIPTIGLQFVF